MNFDGRSHSYQKTLRRTLLQAVPTVLGSVVLGFRLLQLFPGDAAGFQRPHNRRKSSFYLRRSFDDQS